MTFTCWNVVSCVQCRIRLCCFQNSPAAKLTEAHWRDLVLLFLKWELILSPNCRRVCFCLCWELGGEKTTGPSEEDSAKCVALLGSREARTLCGGWIPFSCLPAGASVFSNTLTSTGLTMTLNHSWFFFFLEVLSKEKVLYLLLKDFCVAFKI